MILRVVTVTTLLVCAFAIELLEAGDGAWEASVYRERLKDELDVICGMGFPGYFLIVADFIKWAKEQGIPVGPGRGSGAGSLLAAALVVGNIALYALVYTPLKPRSSLNTLVGAVCGALPPLVGWTAAAGRLDGPAAQ